MRACLAISSFRFDESVLTLLDRAKSDGALQLFDRVIVVDSIGTGAMPALLRERGFDAVEYHCVPRNLGSAGNLAMRLELAAAGDDVVVYAVNHDGSVERGTIERLLTVAEANPGFGALYPIRRLTAQGGGYDVSGRWSVPVPRQVTKEIPRDPLLRVWWSSSNPALYALAPVRSGMVPWADLWMGWEDLGYGWLLAERGFPQFVVTSAITEDGYELRPVFGGKYVADKPAWYAYYTARNLILVGARTRAGVVRSAAIGSRIALEVGVTLAVRPQKRLRLRYLAAGIVDGLRGKTGKWIVP